MIVNLNRSVMKKDEPIFNLMTKELITLNLSDTLYTAEKRLKTNHIRHIPVVEGEALIGLVSLSDLKRISFIDAYNQEGTVDTAIYNMLSIKDLMIKKPITVRSDTTILEVSKLFANTEFHSLPVVDEGKLVGIITTTDLLHYFIDLC
jgi:CBS domain-containing protein